MIRTWLALAVLCAGTASGAGPSYTAAGIVNASSFAPGPFAPGSVISIFGTSLARSTHALVDDDLVACPASRAGRCLPTEMNYVRVYVQGLTPVPLLFVSGTQINFIMSSVERAGPVTVRVVNEGITGPEITVTLVDAAPALFSMAGGFVIATDAKGKLLTADAPAHARDTVVVYVTGLGQTSPNPAVGEIPNYAATMLALASLKVTLDGKAVAPWDVKYAGVTPLSGGLYQINLYLPEGTGNDPEIQVTAGNPTSQTGLRLPVR
ncbi:MAG: hypothetical protein NTW28_13870 [Candidatus Solibacter sp.]|nr:hypothetical protein [Candidatus Solibacter sp.]